MHKNIILYFFAVFTPICGLLNIIVSPLIFINWRSGGIRGQSQLEYTILLTWFAYGIIIGIVYKYKWSKINNFEEKFYKTITFTLIGIIFFIILM